MEDPKLQYMAGWVASDGQVQADPNQGRHVNFYLKATDHAILDLFASWFGGTVRYYDSLRVQKDGPILYQVVKWICWRKDVFEYMLAGDFKRHIIQGDRSAQRRFIQGFLEGDGHVGFRKKSGQFRLTFTNQSKTLLYDVMDHLERHLAVKPKELHLRADNTNQVSYETRTARIIAWYLYRDAEYFLPRKAEVVNRLFGTETDPIAVYCKILFDRPPQVIPHNGGFMFKLFMAKDSKEAAKMTCSGFRLLGIDAVPIPYGKGKEKYYGVYIQPKHFDLLAYMQGAKIMNKFPGNVRLLAA